MRTKYKLTDDKNAGAVRRQAAANFMRMLNSNPSHKYITSIAEMLDIAENWDIAPELKLRNQDGMTKWEQAVRNCIKWQPGDGKDDPLVTNRFQALVDGGCCIPGHCPKKRKVQEFPQFGEGLDAIKPKPRSKRAVFEATMDAEFDAWYKDNHPSGGGVLRSLLRVPFEIGFRTGVTWLRENG